MTMGSQQRTPQGFVSEGQQRPWGCNRPHENLQQMSTGPRGEGSSEDSPVSAGSWSSGESAPEGADRLGALQQSTLEMQHCQVPDPPKSVVKERNRRKRITLSCEQLRELLPMFDGRRNDMASILEMTVKYLEVVHQLVPLQQESSMSTPSTKEYSAVEKQIGGVGRKRKCSKYREKKCKQYHVIENGKQLLNVNIPTAEVPVNLTQSIKVDHVARCIEVPDMENLFPPKHVFQEENDPCSSFAETDHLTLHDEITSLDLSISNAPRCCTPFCAAHDHFSMWATPPQQSPLLSSTSHPWRNQSCDSSRGSLLSSSPANALKCPAPDVLMTPLINDRLQPQLDVRDGMSFLPCTSAADWIDEQDQVQFQPLQDDDQPSSDSLHLFPAATQKKVPEIKDTEFVSEEPDQPLLPAFKDPCGELMEAWQPSHSLDLVYQDPDLSFAEVFF